MNFRISHPYKLSAVLLGGFLTSLTPVQARDLTFFQTSDTHIMVKKSYIRHVEDSLNAIAKIPGSPWPTTGPFVGLSAANVVRPVGLVVPGDLTDRGSAGQWRLYNRLLPLQGRVPDRFPVFAGLGNHDKTDIVRDGLRLNNRTLAKLEPSLVISKGGLHTSWVWQGVTFINVNIFPGAGSHKPGTAWDPQDSLGFLKSRLAHLTKPDAPVIIVMHLPLGDDSRWGQNRRQAFYEVIRDRNVLAILHGHIGITHTRFPDVEDHAAFGKDGPVFDCFSAGGFKNTGRKKAAIASGMPVPNNPCECYVFRITDDRFMAAHWTGVKGGWNPESAKLGLMVVKPIN